MEITRVWPPANGIAFSFRGRRQLRITVALATTMFLSWREASVSCMSSQCHFPWFGIDSQYALSLLHYGPQCLISFKKDDASALDLPTLRRWNLMLRVFMSEYLHLQPRDFVSRFESSERVRRSESELVSNRTFIFKTLLTMFTVSSRDTLVPATSIMQMG